MLDYSDILQFVWRFDKGSGSFLPYYPHLLSIFTFPPDFVAVSGPPFATFAVILKGGEKEVWKGNSSAS